MNKTLRKFLTVVYLSAAATVLAVALDQTRLFRLIALKSADLHYLLEPAYTPDNIVLIVVDQKSLSELHEPLLLWHGYYADVIEAAAGAGAKVLGLDEAFPIPVDKYVPGLDERLMSAVASTSATMPVMCAYVPVAMGNDESQAVPVNMLAAAYDQAAYVNLTADEDDFIRSVELTEQPAPGQIALKSMSLAVAERFLGHLPDHPSRTMLIRYAGPADTFRRISLVDFWRASKDGHIGQLRSWVEGKAVLLGPDTIEDRHATPYYAFRTKGSHANTAGVEIHANALNTLLTGRFLQDVPVLIKVGLMALSALLFSLATMFTSRWRMVCWHAFFTVAILAGTQWSFHSGWLAPVTSIFLSALAAFLLALIVSYLTVARHRDAFRKAVNLFVGSEVAASVESTGKVSLSGRREFVSILFSDIRGFTAFSETQEPETVVALLNDYLSTMTRIIVEHGGQVNKFIGDGILAIFSDEVQKGQIASAAQLREPHAVRAVRCAEKMAAAPSQFTTGTGVHSGYVVMGNVGSGDKLEFTALGDTVNVASRFEGLNKQFGAKVLFSEATKDLIEASLPVVLLGETTVKGKVAAVRVYTIQMEGEK